MFVRAFTQPAGDKLFDVLRSMNEILMYYIYLAV